MESTSNSNEGASEAHKEEQAVSNGNSPAVPSELQNGDADDDHSLKTMDTSRAVETSADDANHGDGGGESAENNHELGLEERRDGEEEDVHDDEDVYDDYDEGDYDEDDESEDEMINVPDEEKTPVTVVTGFLGAGKTTLVNYILKEQTDMKIAVIENEYGAVSIDTALVEENVREAEDIVTMDNGCVCCTVRGDLVKALVSFLDRRKTFDCILLETTGIADPSPIVATFNQDVDVVTNYRIDSVLCLVDAKNILTQLSRRSEREGCINEAVQQLAFADSVIINKTDLVDAEYLQEIKSKITSVNAFAKVVQAEKSRVPLKSVLNLRSYNLDRTLELINEEAKAEEARRKEAEMSAKANALKAEEEKSKENPSASSGGGDHSDKHACGGGCSHQHNDDGNKEENHDHNHGHDPDHNHSHSHNHDHQKKDVEGHKNGHKHSAECGEGCGHSHDQGDKRKREGTEENPMAKRVKEVVRVSSTRHDSKVGSLGLTLQGSLDVDLFNEFMREFLAKDSANLFRLKGVLSFKGQAQKFVFQGVHEQINCEPSRTEWAEDGSDRESKLVFIGLELNKDDISAKLQKCLVSN